jgi:N12 class adenine-specific DNA methylase/adenine-specific DNA methylase
MATKLQLITAMYEHQVSRVTDNTQNWTQFLRSAGRNYKLRFDEQLLVYAQRPEATAVLELENWNKQFKRWVNKGATGIAVIDRTKSNPMRLKYYFDISDTHGSMYSDSRPVPLWQMKPEYEADVIETLEATFGELSDKETLAHAIISAAINAVDDNIADYLHQLNLCREDSFLEELDELNVEVIYTATLKNSIAYMLLARCGIDPTLFFDDEDFQNIHNFNTPNTVNALGLATSDIAETGLREISSTVLNLQKAERTQSRTFAKEPEIRDNNSVSNHERSFENERIDLHRGERVSPARPDRSTGGGNTPWQIRIETPRLPDETQGNPLHQSANAGKTEQPPVGNRPNGTDAVRADGVANGGGAGRDGGTQTGRPNEMGGFDEQYPSLSGGNDNQRVDNQLELFPSLPTPEEQQTNIKEAEVLANEPTSVFSMSADLTQEDIDEELASGSGVEHSKFRIYEQFAKNLSHKENADFLKDEYGWGGHHPAYGIGLGQSHDAKGITITKGVALDNEKKVFLNWTQVEKRIGELIAAERYLNPKEQELYPAWLESEEERRQQRAEETAAREILSRAPTAIPEYRYEYHLGDTVYIGSHEYEVLSFDDAAVNLYDTQFPLFNKEMPREEFDRKIAENPLNNHLRVEIDPTQPTLDEQLGSEGFDKNDGIELVQVGDFYEAYGEDAHILAEVFGFTVIQRNGRDLVGFPSSQLEQNLDVLVNEHNYTVNVSHEDLAKQSEPYMPKIGDRYEIDGRQFVVDTVNAEQNSVSLQDVTFQQNAGFPIFRRESLDFIRRYSPIQEEPVDTNIGEIPIEDYREIKAIQNGFDSYDDMYRQGFRLGDGYDKEPEQSDPTENITPAWEQKKKPVRVNYFDAFPNVPMSERHNYRITDDNFGAGGAKAKFRANMEAIHLLHDLELDGRLATPEEQEILARYVGWGSLPQAFDPDNGAWADEFLELKTSLSTEEYESARATTLNAHYTSPTVIKAIYKALENMGFRSGNILDPGCGIGNFQGLIPDSMRDSKLYGIEIDPITGRIAQQLYQKNSITIQGYEKTALPDSFFDLAIGNVPFGGYKLAEKKYDKHNFLVHDHFFAKTLDKVRPGGIIAFITSKGTFDKSNPAVRKYIAQRAELLGAIRLPNNAFLANAGTQVTSDIIFLQKRDRIVDIEPEWVHLSTVESENGEQVPVNQYFADHPDMILGEMVRDDMMYGNGSETTCKPYPDRNLSDLLDEAIQNIHGEVLEYTRDEDEQEQDGGIPADPNIRNFSFCLVDGKIYYRENSMMYPRDLTATAQSRVRGMLELRDCVRTLIEYQTENYPDGDIKTEQVKLNRLYDSYTKKYGLLNDRANALAFDDDSSYALLCSLEVLDEDRKLKAKADMFTKRTINPPVIITHCDTAVEALAVSLSDTARVDLDLMSELTGMDEETLIKELDGIIFLNIGNATDQNKTYVTADEYLSGNVREKLALAIAAQKTFPDGRYDGNVKALQAAMPKDLEAPEISIRLGATWIPPEIIKQFITQLLTPNWRAECQIAVLYSEHTAEWNITGKSADNANIKSFNTYGTQRMNAYWIIENTLNLRDVRVYDTQYDPSGKEVRVLNKRETAIAQDKQDLIKEKFAEWVWSDPHRREVLCKIYNERFNSVRPREFDGSHLTFPGMNPEICLNDHQKNAVARHIYGGNALFGHTVGAGKTFSMIAAAMEGKRIGLCSKPMFVVPNNIIGDFAGDFFRLYPAANVLMATAKDFEKKNRRKFCARIATGDYDGIIIGHSQFEKLPVSINRQIDTIERQIRDITAGIAEVKAKKGERFTVKQMEKSRKSLQAKLAKLNDQSRKDDLVTFEELGVDRLFIDEADLFKNLYFITKMRNVAGIAQSDAQKAADLFMKTQFMDDTTNRHGVVFATGTPVSNTMAEVYTMQRYLQYDTLRQNGLEHFDCWASTFGETVNSMEITPDGTGFQQKTRFSRFYNLPELMNMFKGIADIQTKDMLNLPTPKVNYHVEVCQPSDMQKEMVEGLGERADRIRRREVDATEDNMLLITNDGRKIALDQRLINPMLPDFEGSKVNRCVNNVFDIWERTRADRLTQIIFSDLSTPKGDGKFNVYDDIKAKLIARGVPADEIAFIHEAKNELQKKELFAKVRTGKIRVLLGSTSKCGAGTNIQDKLVALHDLDCPWRPRDLEQRLGRIERQGNGNDEVDVFRYVTEHTFDAYLYQMIENKQRYIGQIFTSKTPARVMQEIDEVSLNYAEIKALATGNPEIIEHCQLQADVSKLKTLKASHLSQRYELEDKVLKHFPADIRRTHERIKGYTTDTETVKSLVLPDGYPIVINGNFYNGDEKNGKMFKLGDKDEKKQAGEIILKACKSMTTPEPVSLGHYRGFDMDLSFDSFNKEYRITLKGALSHTINLGTDIYGNFTRLDNALEGLETKLTACKEQLANTKAQMETAKEQIQAPFPREGELAEKTARLAELTVSLKLNENDREVLDGVPDAGDSMAQPRRKDRERDDER